MKYLVFILGFALCWMISACEEITPGVGTAELKGSWRLVYNSGGLHDVCPGETANFPSNSGGIAALKCPDRDTVYRSYTVSNSILTYTETGISYRIAGLSTSELQLEGTGSSQGRYLYYSKMTTD